MGQGGEAFNDYISSELPELKKALWNKGRLSSTDDNGSDHKETKELVIL